MKMVAPSWKSTLVAVALVLEAVREVRYILTPAPGAAMIAVAVVVVRVVLPETVPS